MSLRDRFLMIWLPIVVTGAGIVLFGWVAVQQTLRLDANYPQRQMAEDAVNALQNGAQPSVVASGMPVNEGTSLAPFMTITDTSGKVLASTGHLNGQVPLPPLSALQDSQTRRDFFTWQHQGIRDAAVVIPFGGDHPGYVIAARSLREVEGNEALIGSLALLTLLGVLVAPALLLLIPSLLPGKDIKRSKRQ